ncbi:hypothetical protein [uncultured Treponema sp.]|uniref:hypothetical protein n=1 Tax=uncultured Treponema sp. TaxID=162155 RepID=UPI0025E7066E|nr:hypothetical protein [uncultured Treponema sp.]
MKNTKKNFFYGFMILIFAGTAFFNSCKIVDGDELRAENENYLQKLIDQKEDGEELDLSKIEDGFSLKSVEINKAITLSGGETQFDMQNIDITVNVPGVTLKNLANLNSVIFGEGIKKDDIALENCSIKTSNEDDTSDDGNIV